MLCPDLLGIDFVGADKRQQSVGDDEGKRDGIRPPCFERAIFREQAVDDWLLDLEERVPPCRATRCGGSGCDLLDVCAALALERDIEVIE